MRDNKSVQIGEQIKYYRTLKGMSQESLALAAGINPAFVGHIERGMKSPTVNTLQKISGALQVSLAELFTPITKEASSGERKAEIEHVEYLLENLSDEELRMIVQLLDAAVRFRKLPID